MDAGGLLPKGGFSGLRLRRYWKLKNPLPDPKAKDGGFKRDPKRLDMEEFLER